MKKLIVAGMVILATGCAPHIETVNLVDGASKVRVFRKSDPPPSCVEISPFSAVSGNGCGALGNPGNYGATYNTFRNMIVEMGGNAGLLTDEIRPHSEPGCLVNTYIMNGVAFKCLAEVLNEK